MTDVDGRIYEMVSRTFRVEAGEESTVSFPPCGSVDVAEADAGIDRSDFGRIGHFHPHIADIQPKILITFNIDDAKVANGLAGADIRLLRNIDGGVKVVAGAIETDLGRVSGRNYL